MRLNCSRYIVADIKKPLLGEMDGCNLHFPKRAVFLSNDWNNGLFASVHRCSHMHPALRPEVIAVREPVSAEFFGFQQQLVGVDISFFHGGLEVWLRLVIIEPEGS